jgi:hypothetical protein
MALGGGPVAEPLQAETGAEYAVSARAVAPLHFGSFAPALSRAADATRYAARDTLRAEATTWHIDMFRLVVAMAGLAGFLLLPVALIASVVFLLFR